MLPFLKPKTVAGIIMTKRKSDGGMELPENEGPEGDSLEACAEDLIRAIHSKDARAVAAAWRAGAECLGAAEDDESFDAQNEKAAE